MSCLSHRRLVRGIAALSLGLLLGAVSALADESPGLVLEESRILLSPTPAILELDEVREHLDTGLTTSFVFEVTIKGLAGGKRSTTSVIEVRWDPWEEQYYLRVRSALATRERLVQVNFEALVGWWKQSRIALIDGIAGADPSRLRGRLRLTVVPFSSGEVLDARRWFADALTGGGRGVAEKTTDRVREEGDPLRGMLSALMATSIARRSALEYEWSIPVRSEGAR